jgi:hypothetical protein
MWFSDLGQSGLSTLWFYKPRVIIGSPLLKSDDVP